MKNLIAPVVLFLFFTSCTYSPRAESSRAYFERQASEARQFYHNGVISKQQYSERRIAIIREANSRTNRDVFFREMAAYAIILWERWAKGEISESERSYLVAQKQRQLAEAAQRHSIEQQRARQESRRILTPQPSPAPQILVVPQHPPLARTYSTPSVIESQIDGEFNGWEGETLLS